jgi:hypothetical protein
MHALRLAHATVCARALDIWGMLVQRPEDSKVQPAQGKPWAAHSTSGAMRAQGAVAVTQRKQISSTL